LGYFSGTTQKRYVFASNAEALCKKAKAAKGLCKNVNDKALHHRNDGCGVEFTAAYFSSCCISNKSVQLQ